MRSTFYGCLVRTWAFKGRSVCTCRDAHFYEGANELIKNPAALILILLIPRVNQSYDDTTAVCIHANVRSSSRISRWRL
jgi:hypothetical protein